MTLCIEHKQKGIGLGYGSTSRKGKTYWMHRVVYCEANNLTLDAINGEVVRHKCDNPRCINPEHLELGTHKDNMLDMTSRNRQAVGERQGAAKLTATEVMVIRESYVRGSKEFGQYALSRRFKVDQTTIKDILKGRNWKHLLETNS